MHLTLFLPDRAVVNDWAPQNAQQNLNTVSHSVRQINLYCKISDITISVLERIYTNDSATRKQRESHWIEQLELYTKGINRRR